MRWGPEAGEIHVEKSREEDGEEQIIFEPALEEAKGFTLLYPFCRQVDDRPQRADPAAKKSAENGGTDQEKETGEKKDGERLRREQAGQADKRVHPEKTVEGNGDLVLAPIIRSDEEEEKKDKEEELKNAGKVNLHVARRYALTILTFSKFISPSPLLARSP